MVPMPSFFPLLLPEHHPMNSYNIGCLKTPDNTIPMEMRGIQLGRRKARSASIEATMHSVEKKILARVANITISCEDWKGLPKEESLPLSQAPSTPLFSLATVSIPDLSFPEIGGSLTGKFSELSIPNLQKRSFVCETPLTPRVSNTRRYKKRKHSLDNAPYIPVESPLSEELSLPRLLHRYSQIPKASHSSPFIAIVSKTPCTKRRRRRLLARQHEQMTTDFPIFPCLSPHDRPLIPTLHS